MARQKGIFKLEGQMGDITFYKTHDGFLVRAKSSLNGDRVKNDPAFERTRENSVEFGSASAAGKILRTALRTLTLHASDNGMMSRLTREMIKVIQSDAINPRGKRNVADGEMELLQGFEFNENGKLNRTFLAPFIAEIDRLTGALTITIPDFVPDHTILAPQGTTHLKLISAGAEIDFERKTYLVNASQSAIIVYGPQTEGDLILENVVTPVSEMPLFLVFGIEFYQQVNGVMYPLKSNVYNALAIVKVDGWS